jgi:trimeric autotransporter adhesin
MDLNKPWGWKGNAAPAGPLSNQLAPMAASQASGPSHTQLPPSEEEKLAADLKGKAINKGVDMGTKKVGDLYTQYTSPTLGADSAAAVPAQGAPLGASGQMALESTYASAETPALDLAGQGTTDVAAGAATDAAAGAATDAAAGAATDAAAGVATDAATSAATDAAASAATDAVAGAAVEGAASSLGSSMIPYVGAVKAAAEGDYATAVVNALATTYLGPVAGAAAGAATNYITGYENGTTGVPAAAAPTGGKSGQPSMASASAPLAKTAGPAPSTAPALASVISEGNNPARASAGARFAPELFQPAQGAGGKAGSTASRPTAPTRAASSNFMLTPTAAQQAINRANDPNTPWWQRAASSLVADNA